MTFGDDKGVAESVATLAADPGVGFGSTWAVDGDKPGALLGELSYEDWLRQLRDSTYVELRLERE